MTAPCLTILKNGQEEELMHVLMDIPISKTQYHKYSKYTKG